MSDKKIVQLAKPSPNNDEVIETIKAFQQIAQDISLTSVMLVGLGPGQTFATQAHIVGGDRLKMIAMMDITKLEMIHEVLDDID